MTAIHQVFAELEARLGPELHREHGLRVKCGQHLGADVLKLVKDSWTPDSHEEIGNRTGVFCALWCDLAPDPPRLVHYNIHALTLARLGDHKIKARALAQTFRQQAKHSYADWPGVRTDYGPLTLLQGAFAYRGPHLFEDCRARIAGFAAISPVIDALLAPHLASAG
jgi:hypothetical protein